MEAVIERSTWHGLEELRNVLRCLLSRHCADQNEVEDVIHETYLRAARYRTNLSEGRRLKPWAMRIALNVLSDRKRRGRRFVITSPEDATLETPMSLPPAEDELLVQIGRWELDKETALRLLGQAMCGLKADDRRVLDSFYRGAQSCRETAEECGIPAHLVKVRLFRARQRLLRAIHRRLALEDV